jgi:hypothetical protein
MGSQKINRKTGKPAHTVIMGSGYTGAIIIPVNMPPHTGIIVGRQTESSLFFIVLFDSELRPVFLIQQVFRDSA